MVEYESAPADAATSGPTDPWGDPPNPENGPTDGLADQLAADGYPTIDAWMTDSDYIRHPDGDWYDEHGNGPYDPWTQYLHAKEADAQALLDADITRLLDRL